MHDPESRQTLGEHRSTSYSSEQLDDIPLVTRRKPLRAQIEDETSTRILAVWPLITHFILTFLVGSMVLTLVHNHSFSFSSRRPGVVQADSSVAHLGFTLLQTDVTTALSFSMTIMRFVAGLWTASTVWRCIFILLEKDGIHLGDIAWMLRWGLPARLRGPAVPQIALILLLSFPVQFSSPILTGSITWRQSEFSVAGNKLVHGISVSTYGYGWDQYSRFTLQIGDTVIQHGTAIADIAWGRGSSANATNSTKRVLPTTRGLPIGAVLENVTVPYFVVDALEWIDDPGTLQQIWSQNASANYFNPFMNAEGPYVGFFPVNSTWGPSPDPGGLPKPITMAETRIMVTLIDRLFNATNTTSCTSRSTRYYGEIPPEVKLVANFNEDPPHSSAGFTNCYSFARVTFRAGVRSCHECRLSPQTVLQFRDDSTASELLPDTMVSDAIALAPKLAQSMITGNFSIPSPINNINHFVSEMLSRSYQAAWTALTDKFNEPPTSVATSVMIPVQVSQAQVVRWRVGIWMMLNSTLMLSGLLFFHVQRSCEKRMVIDAEIATLLLDSGDVLRGHANRELDDLSILTKEDSQEVGQVRLVTRNGSRRLTSRRW